MIERFNANRFSDALDGVEVVLGRGVAIADVGLTLTQPDAAYDLLSATAPNRQGFHMLEVSGFALQTDPVLRRVLGRVVLMGNQRLQAFSPVIITDGKRDGCDLTMLDQPYVPTVGFTAGQHFGLSVKAQASVPEFGGHNGAGAYEAGHFGAVLLGSRNGQVARRMEALGDWATDRVIAGGVPDALSRADLLPVAYRTHHLNPDDRKPMAVFWHPSLDSEGGPVGGDYPGAIRLMLGAGVDALGSHGVEEARRLLEYADEGVW